jgi:inositol oxygenase
MYHVAKDYLPEEARYMIRYHSFYPAHQEGEYEYLMSERDETMFKWVVEFQNYDLYSKSKERPDLQEIRPYYEQLIAEYFPPQILW